MSDSQPPADGLVPSRRRFLAVVGASAGSLAGCLDDGDDESGNSDDGTSDDDSPDSENPDGSNDPSEQGEQPPDSESTIPITGTAVPELDALDDAMVSYMTDLDVDGGALGVAHRGEVVFERGYGWADDSATEETPPDALFRIASISKSLTKAALSELDAGGQLSPDDRALPYLDIEPPEGNPADDRFAEITIQQLLDHEAGLPPSRVPGDPVFEPRQVADALDLDGPPDSEDMVRYLLDQPLAYEPGTDSRYSNSGYVVLGHVIAGAASESYQSYLDSVVLPEPDDIGLARTDPAEREPREVAYHSEFTAPTALDLDSDREVSLPDGGFLVELLGAAGGHYASTRALLAFMDEYWVFFGRPRDESVRVENPAAIGSIPGTYAVAFHQDDVDVVALFNRRVPGESEAILDSLRRAVTEVESWPS